MVQIIPEVPSFGAQFARSLGGGLSKGIESATDYASKLGIDKAKQQQKLKLLTALLGEDFSAGMDAQSEVGHQLRGGDASSQQNTSGMSSQKRNLAAFAIDPEVGNFLQQQDIADQKAEREEKRAAEKITSQAKKETLPLRKEFTDKAKYARQGIENKKTMLELLKRGKIDDPLTVEASKYLPGAIGNKLLSPDTQLYKTGLFDEFGVLKTMFPGQIRVKEIELLEDKLATLDKSHEAKAKILETGLLKLDRDIIMAKAAREVEKEYPNAGLLEFESLVSEKAQPEIDKLFDKIVKNYDKIYFEYAPAKSSYVDQFGDEYPNIPKSDLKRLFDEAKEQGLELRRK
jgi:hypothetical protein